MKQHLAQIAFGKTIGGIVRGQTTFDRRVAHALVVDTAAVVLDFNINMVAAVISAERNRADF